MYIRQQLFSIRQRLFIELSTIASNLQFIPGKNRGTQNPVLDGFRYVVDKKKNDTTYWKCFQFRKGCRARISTIGKQLTSPAPEHTHDPLSAEIAVHVAKQTLKRKAAKGDMPTKYLCSEAGMGFEARAKLGCQLSSLSRMARRNRQVASRHPSNPRSLEDLRSPADYILSHSNESIMLWDSGWEVQTKRSLVRGTPTNASTMVDAEHWVLDGTFKSAPDMFYISLTTGTFHYSMDFCQGKRHFYTRTYLKS